MAPALLGAVKRVDRDLALARYATMRTGYDWQSRVGLSRRLLSEYPPFRADFWKSRHAQIWLIQPKSFRLVEAAGALTPARAAACYQQTIEMAKAA